MAATFSFILNSEVVTVDCQRDQIDPNSTTLSQWLRATGKTGTKEGCAEGDCGACSVAVASLDKDGQPTWQAITSCITFLPQIAGREIVTVEGVGNGAVHPVQAAMVHSYGSQCGYCTPGFITTMFAGYERSDLRADDEDAICDQLNGNLCRCTGYRPIREAMVCALRARDGELPADLIAIGARDNARRGHHPHAEAVPLSAVDLEQGTRFVRPCTLDELLWLRAQHKDAAVVAGATELGVLLRKRHIQPQLLLSIEAVPELRGVDVADDRIVIGGAATLSELEDAIADAPDLLALVRLLRVFASRQIRNRATVAGNIVTASPIGDLAPVLLALDAVVEVRSLTGTRAIPMVDFFVGYRRTALAADEIVTRIVVPRPKGALGTFKVSKRREVDIAIVSAAFHLVIADGTIREARLAYGGVAALPVRARRTEDLLIGAPATEQTLQAALAVLAAEFSPIDDVRASAAYRDGLVPSLFEKFWRNEHSESQDRPLRFVPSSFPACEDASRGLPHDSGLLHATGAARYVDDTAALRGGVLELWPVRVPHARARILKKDATRARAMPGVVAVLFAEDIPGDNDIGAIRKDEPLLAALETSFFGQMVAVVVAQTQEQARRAALAVELEAEPLPAIVGIRAALAAESFQTERHVMKKGDVDTALQQAPHRLQAELEIGGQDHFYLETHAAFSEVGDEGDIRVLSSTQHPSEVQAAVAHVLHVPRNQVVVTSPRMGGGFGGKETQGNTWAALTALAALKTGRPVRIQLDRDLNMELMGKRHPFLARYEVGFADDGRILGLRAELFSDGGYALDLSESIHDRALFHLDNAYDVPAMEVSGRVVRTHVMSHTAFRGFGGPQGMLVIEDVLARVALACGLAPEIVRARNFYAPTGGTTHYGQPVSDHRIPRMWTQLLSSSDFARRRAEISAENARSPAVKRGLAITPVKFGISFTASFLNQAGALVHIYRDGSVQVNHGGTEMGQGLYTKIIGIVMRELGLPREMVRVMQTRTDKVPNTSATAASSGTDLNGAAVQLAVRELRERLLPVAALLVQQCSGMSVDPVTLVFENGSVYSSPAKERGVSFARVAEAAYLQQIHLSSAAYYRTPDISYDKKSGRGTPFHYFAYGVCVAEVELDARSGMKSVRRVDILHDVGDSLHAAIDRGQIEGGFVQGVGWLTGEELRFSPDGRLLTHSASTYQIPTMGDAPADFRVALLTDAAKQPGVVHGSKAVGEPPLMLALAVREALRDAIGAFGGRTVDLPSPLTHEVLFAALRG